MDIKLFLDPVSPDCISEKRSADSFQQSIFINNEIMYDLDGIDIVLLGITDSRDSYENIKFDDGPDNIRKKLYALTKTSGNNRILDLGNLRNGPTEEETRTRLAEVCEYLLSENILPIIIGGSHSMDLGHYKGYETLDKLITVLNVDAKLDIESESSAGKGHIAEMFKHDPNFLFNYIHFGYQSYFTSPSSLEVLENLSFEKVRLGEIHDNLIDLEPVIRDADMVTFDVSAISSRFLPASENPNIFGLTGEEACQITWYAGLSDKLSSIGFYEYSPEKDDENLSSASVIATMIWYFIDGFYNRKGDKNFMTNDYTVFEVDLGGTPDTIRFYKSKLSEKWWMEITDIHSDSVFLRNKMIPCSYSDYETATNGEVPERWLLATKKT